MSTPDLQIKAVFTDQVLRKNFENLKAYFDTQNQLLDFGFFEQVFTEAVSGKKIAHGLAYVPLDILVTRISGAGIVTFLYGEFDKTSIVLDASGPCRVRFFAGTYSRLKSSVETGPSDQGEFSASV